MTSHEYLYITKKRLINLGIYPLLTRGGEEIPNDDQSSRSKTP